MNYALILLEKGLKEVVETRKYIVADTFPSPINNELIKIDYQIETVKNAIEFLKHNTRRTNTQIIEEIAKKYDLSRSDVATLIEEKPKFGI
jgi:hypothetical protein